MGEFGKNRSSFGISLSLVDSVSWGKYKPLLSQRDRQAFPVVLLPCTFLSTFYLYPRFRWLGHYIWK